MDQQQPLQEPELGNRIIRGVDSLETLFARNTNAHVSGLQDRQNQRVVASVEARGSQYLNHANVIGTVSDSESHGTQTILDESDDESLL